MSENRYGADIPGCVSFVTSADRFVTPASAAVPFVIIAGRLQTRANGPLLYLDHLLPPTRGEQTLSLTATEASNPEVREAMDSAGLWTAVDSLALRAHHRFALVTPDHRCPQSLDNPHPIGPAIAAPIG